MSCIYQHRHSRIWCKIRNFFFFGVKSGAVCNKLPAANLSKSHFCDHLKYSSLPKMCFSKGKSHKTYAINLAAKGAVMLHLCNKSWYKQKKKVLWWHRQLVNLDLKVQPEEKFQSKYLIIHLTFLLVDLLYYYYNWSSPVIYSSLYHPPLSWEVPSKVDETDWSKKHYTLMRN